MSAGDDDTRRWAPPGHPSRADASAVDASGADAPTAGRRADTSREHSPAAPWTRGVRATARPGAASDRSQVSAPDVPWTVPETATAEARPERSMVPIAIGVAMLAVLACVPHWVAPTIALIVALVGLPIAWGFRRISRGRRRVQYIVVVLALLLVVALAVIAPLCWLQLGVLQPLSVPA